MNCPT